MTSWILNHPVPPAARARLLCLPYSGGGGSSFRSWCDELAPEIEVVPIQLPGRENRFREPALASMAQIIAALLPVAAALDDRPFALFGHSAGARIAYELTLALRKAGRRLPAHLYVSACRAPHVKSVHPLMGRMSDPELLRTIVMRYGDDAQVKDEELYRLMLPTIRADILALETCPISDVPPLDLPITGLWGHDDRYVSENEIDAWRACTTSRFERHAFEGAHFYLNRNKAALFDLVRRGLAGSGGVRPSS